MTQFQFDIICNIIQSGAPALANELCSSLNDLVVDRNQLAQQVKHWKAESQKLEGPNEHASEKGSSK